MRTLLAGFVMAFAAAADASPEVVAAAKKAYPAADWQEKSVVHGNFSCRGRNETAVLGTSKAEIVVAVFLNGLERKPEILRYSTKTRAAESAILTTEPLDF